MNNPLVSIIINNYNYGQFLQEAIDSALNQTYLNTEVVVVDDGSTDNSQDMIKSYGDKIVPVLKANGGQASAFNAGFATSRGDIICFLDSDDMFMPEKVAQIVDVFSSHQNPRWCYHPLQLIDNNTGTITQNSYDWSSGEYDLRAALKKGKLRGKIPCIPATSGLCFRRSLLQQILPMPEADAVSIGDTYLKFTALALSEGFALAQELATQRIHATNAFTLRQDKQQLIARIHTLTAYWMRINFPFIKNFANNLFAVGIGFYWRTGGIEAAYQKVVQSYFSSLLPLERLEINFRAFYHCLK
jgi:glycosyltransferase involved in cell wall biosynthesis